MVAKPLHFALGKMKKRWSWILYNSPETEPTHQGSTEPHALRHRVILTGDCGN